MKSIQSRTFIVNNKKMKFNAPFFCELFRMRAQERGMGLGKYEFEVADYLCVDASTIHNWRNQVNGPSDLEKIQSLANFWNINYERLLMEETTMEVVTPKKSLNDRERTALKNVYISFLNYLNVFLKTSGFLWNADGSDYNIGIAYALYDQTTDALEREFIDLKSSVYDDLKALYQTYLTESLMAFWDEENGETIDDYKSDVSDFYQHAIDAFKEIITPYIM